MIMKFPENAESGYHHKVDFASMLAIAAAESTGPPCLNGCQNQSVERERETSSEMGFTPSP